MSGGMSTKRMRVPWRGGKRIGPTEGSGPFPTGAGLPSVLQTSWKTVPGSAVSSPRSATARPSR